MPLDQGDLSTEILNRRYEGMDARAMLADWLGRAPTGRTALVSSFGADSVVLLHLVARIDPATPVLFIDSLMLFSETLDYQRDVAATLGLSDVRVIRADRQKLFQRDPDNILHLADQDACCALRKTEPLHQALAGFDSWISGRKRFQGGARAALPLVEAEGARLKLNPLAHWDAARIAAHIDAHGLPRHPLADRGFPSIGCAPCTSPVRPGEDPRAGRWRGSEKTECGIHFSGGAVVREARA